jgi:type IV secretory pathway TrbL component
MYVYVYENISQMSPSNVFFNNAHCVCVSLCVCVCDCVSVCLYVCVFLCLCGVYGLISLWTCEGWRDIRISFTIASSSYKNIILCTCVFIDPHMLQHMVVRKQGLSQFSSSIFMWVPGRDHQDCMSSILPHEPSAHLPFCDR